MDEEIILWYFSWYLVILGRDKLCNDLTVLPSPGMMGIVAETMGKSSSNG